MLKNVFISTSRGKSQSVKTEATNWGTFVQELEKIGLSTDGMKAIIGGLNLTLDVPTAQLPNTDFTLFLTPVKIKAGSAGYDFGYAIEDIEGLTFNELKGELKSIRLQAVGNDDEDTLAQIGNYTHMGTQQLANTLKSVYLTLNPIDDKTIVEDGNDPALENRIFEIEYKLGIVNSSNEEQFFARKSAERKMLEEQL